jgi:hypothetical protein
MIRAKTQRPGAAGFYSLAAKFAYRGANAQLVAAIGKGWFEQRRQAAK